MHVSLTIAMEFHCRSLAGAAKSAILQKKLVVVTRRDSLVIEVPPVITEGLLCLFSFSPLSVLGVTFWECSAVLVTSGFFTQGWM